MKKCCSKCKKLKPLEDFAKDGDGRRSDCKLCNTKQSLSYYENHKNQGIERAIAWKENNPKLVKAYRKANYLKNKEKIHKYNQLPHNKIKINLRNRLNHACRGRKCSTTHELVGCSWQDLMNHIEAKFQFGMTWENYGDWHIDHRKPCASFDLTIPEQQKICFHYTNLQPLWAKDNLVKGKKPATIKSPV